ncbi:HEAT repeat domain-containing protein [Candidatus Formimonas warabiya]|uniref:HEAT repeat domain-containing protein n=1 Tax=Formimonas warabiya TaxID=1761012 RepID=A0A3G1KUX4_FORW1|nr:HEAT repeat domain-containing protein [Candidatus Formimonas warabiya]ATW26234.1 hypothetical protein DCMF_17010 [Candidatus Formimonas warabiya]
MSFLQRGKAFFQRMGQGLLGGPKKENQSPHMIAVLKAASGRLPDRLLVQMRSGGIKLVPVILEIWPQLAPEIRDQLVILWEEEGYLDHYIRALGAKGEEERIGASAVLGKIKDKRLIVPLMKALGEPGQYVPARVAEVLISLGQEAVDPMAHCLANLPETPKCLVISILEEIGDRKALPALIHELSHDSAQVRMRTVDALGEIGDQEAVDALLLLMRDPDWGVRSRSAKALGMMGAYQAVTILEEALHDEAWWVRTNAREALNKIVRPVEEQDA